MCQAHMGSDFQIEPGGTNCLFHKFPVSFFPGTLYTSLCISCTFIGYSREKEEKGQIEEENRAKLKA